MLEQKEAVESALKAIEEKINTLKLSESEKAEMLNAVKSTITAYQAHFGVDCDFGYRMRKRLDHFEIRLYFKGEQYKPSVQERNERQRLQDRFMQRLPKNRSISISHLYILDKNICIIRSPLFIHDKNWLKNPTVWAIFSGLVFGLICRFLPANFNRFIVEDIVEPLYSLITKVMAGIAGPVVFLTLLSSIASMESLTEFNSLGVRIFKRFILVLSCIAVLTVGFCLLFFNRSISAGGMAINFDGIREILLGVVPTNVFTPFTENNLPQLMVLAIGLGAALLVFGEQATELTSIIDQLQQWIMILLRFIYKAVPVIPFMCLFKMIAAKNNTGEILHGGKFILAMYLCLSVITLAKLILVAARTKINPLIIIKKLKPVLVKGLVTGSFSATLDERRVIAKEQLGINANYSDFWISISYSMLNMTLPVELAVSVFFVAEMSGMTFSFSMLIISFLIIMQLSLASVDRITAWTMLFGQLGLSTNYIGLLTLCNMLVSNFKTMCSVFMNDLEQIEDAYLMDMLDTDKLQCMD